MHLRRSTALLVGALLIALSALSACAADGRNAATGKVNQMTVGVDHRDGQVFVLNAVVVSKSKGSGTFVPTLVNKSPDAAHTLSALSGDELKVDPFSPVSVPPQGLVNLAEGDRGLPLSGDFSAGQYVQLTVALGDSESAVMNVPVVPDSGDFAGLDRSATAS